MIDFFIALFGVLFCGSIISSERISKIESSKHFQYYSAFDKEIGKQIKATAEYENAVKERLLCGKFAEQIYYELRADLDFIFGKADIKRVFPLPRFRCNKLGDLRSPYYWAYLLLLSHQGKILRFEYMYGFPLGGANSKEQNIRICQRIEYNLRQHHNGIRLLLNTGLIDDTSKFDSCAKSRNIGTSVLLDTYKRKSGQCSFVVKNWRGFCSPPFLYAAY